jgi:hypothetical protein
MKDQKCDDKEKQPRKDLCLEIQKMLVILYSSKTSYLYTFITGSLPAVSDRCSLLVFIPISSDLFGFGKFSAAYLLAELPIRAKPFLLRLLNLNSQYT